MNSLSTLDRYLLDRWKGSSGNTRTPSRRGSSSSPASSSGSSRRREQVVVPESVLASTEPVLDPGNELLSPASTPPTAGVTRAQPKRRPTGYPGLTASTSTDTGSSSNSTATSLGNNAPDNQRRRKRARGQGRRVPPRKRHRNPEEGWMTAGFVGVLGLWSDLWTVIFGPDEEDLVNAKVTVQHGDRHEGKGREDEVSASSASETETEEKDRRGRRRGGRSGNDETDGGWTDPVTRAPDDPEELLRQAAEAEMLSSNGTSTATPEKSQASERRSSPQLVSFQLGKQKSDSMDQTQTSSYSNSEHSSSSTASILTNSSNNARHTLPTLLPTIQFTHASGNTNILMETRRQPPADPSRHRNTKLLPAPLSVPLSASASKRREQLIRNTHNQHQPTISITSIPRSLSTTPFHRPKTLILDLDETLIHSTSRPMSLQSSGMGSGSGIMGISLSGLFSGGKHQRGGGGARGEGHVVEVVLGGRSTLYHVYKRPYVDHFLKKVSRLATAMRKGCSCRASGVFLVYPRDIHGEHARIRRSSHRLARRRSRLLCQEAVSRGESGPVFIEWSLAYTLPPVVCSSTKRIVYQGPLISRGRSQPSLLHG